MIACAPIWAIVVRHMRVLLRDLNVLLMGFCWPLLDVLIWGFLGAWIQQSQMAEFHNYTVTALMGIFLWQVVGRGCNIMINALCEELWSNNVVNLFSLPLHLYEWMCGVVLFYVIMMFITVIFCMVITTIMYDVSLWYIFSTFLIFLPPLFFSGLWLGFTCFQIILILGKRGIELGQVIVWFLLPLSGAYYPVEVLPAWGQKLSALLPMSYVFKGMRGYLMYQQDPTPYLIKGYVISIVYASCAVMLFVNCFNRSRRRGLARLVD